MKSGSVRTGALFTAVFQLCGHNLGDVLYLDAAPAFVQAALELEYAARAVSDQYVRTAFFHMVNFMLENLGGYFREVHRIGAAESAAHIFIGRGYIFKTGDAKEAAGRVDNVQSAAQVAGGMVGDGLFG